jgi:hypothetical protein
MDIQRGARSVSLAQITVKGHFQAILLVFFGQV